MVAGTGAVTLQATVLGSSTVQPWACVPWAKQDPGPGRTGPEASREEVGITLHSSPWKWMSPYIKAFLDFSHFCLSSSWIKPEESNKNLLQKERSILGDDLPYLLCIQFSVSVDFIKKRAPYCIKDHGIVLIFFYDKLDKGKMQERHTPQTLCNEIGLPPIILFWNIYLKNRIPSWKERYSEGINVT